jgi:opacity protein-like surface antigen
METDTISKALTAIEVIVAVILVSYYVGHNRGINEAGERVVERVDTLVVRDTITQYEPIVERITKVEKVLVPVTDTLRLTDTLYVVLDREQKMWEDSLVRVYVSGIMPEVDSVVHYVTERVITREVIVPKVRKTRWGIGINAGYGVQLGSEVRMTPYVGIGVSYDIVSW